MAAIHVSESILIVAPKPICTNCEASVSVISPFAEIGY
jgi:hypothetical protein